MSKPISPSEVASHKAKIIPPGVIETFNKLIALHFVNGYSSFLQKDVIKELVDNYGFNQEEFFEKHWLDVESIYEENGWRVEYDAPAYNESYSAKFIFRTKR